MEKLPKLKYELQDGYHELFCPCEMDEIYGRALNTSTPAGSQTSKIDTAKEMINLVKKEDDQKTKTNVD